MKKNHQAAFSVLTLLFFMWGFITVTNDILVNGFKQVFQLTAVQRSLVQQSFFGAFFFVSLLYFLLSALTGRDPINRFGYHRGMIVGLVLCGLGCMLFYPAALFVSYTSFLLALFVLATGVAVLQICANPYATVLGRPETSGSRLNLAQGFNSLGTTLGPAVGFVLIYRVFSDGEPTAMSIAHTYLIYGGLFLLLAFVTGFARMPGFQNNEAQISGLAVLRQPRLIAGILAIFFYVGSEVSVGTWLVEFLKSPEGGGLSEAAGSYFLTYFWGGLMIGRLAGSAVLGEGNLTVRILKGLAIAIAVMLLVYVVTSVVKSDTGFVWQFMPLSDIWPYAPAVGLMFLALTAGRGNSALTLMIFSAINVVLFILISKGLVASGMWLAITSGLFFSVGWSNIFSLAISGLGPMTSKASSLLVLAIVGGAVLPVIQARLITESSVAPSFIVPAMGMTFVALYGFYLWKRPEG